MGDDNRLHADDPHYHDPWRKDQHHNWATCEHPTCVMVQAYERDALTHAQDTAIRELVEAGRLLCKAIDDHSSSTYITNMALRIKQYDEAAANPHLSRWKR